MADSKYISPYSGQEIDDRLGKAHEHTNKLVLDGITSAKVSSWDAKAEISDIPTAVSDLTNDAGYLTSSDDVMFEDTAYLAVTPDSEVGVDGSMTPRNYDWYTADELSQLITTVGIDNGSFLTVGAFNDFVRLGGVQRKLIPGTNITIAADGTISASGGGGSSTWGSITGDISDQVDLQNALADKQDSFNLGGGVGIDVGNNLYVKTTGEGLGVNGSNQLTLMLGTGLAIGTSGTDLNKLVCTVQPSGGATWGSITGTLSSQTDLQSALNSKADSSSVPTKTSDLTNDSGFITSASLPTNVSDLTNDSGFQTSGEVSTAISTAIDALDASLVGGNSGSFLFSISESNGKITATGKGMDGLGTGGTMADSSQIVWGTSGSNVIRKGNFSTFWSYILGKITDVLGISTSHPPVKSGTNVQYTLQVVASMPASPDPNTIYYVI